MGRKLSTKHIKLEFLIYCLSNGNSQLRLISNFEFFSSTIFSSKILNFKVNFNLKLKNVQN